MTPDREAETASYWRRHVPAAAALSAAGGLLAAVPLVNALAAVGVPAALAVLFLRRRERALERWLPALVLPLLLLGVPSLRLFAALPLCLAAAGIVLDAGLRSGRDWRLTAAAVALPYLAALGLGFAVMGTDALREQLLLGWDSYAALLQTLGLDPAGFEAQFKQGVELVITTLPSQVAVTAIMTGLMALAVTVWWLARTGFKIATGMEAFSCWELPRWFAGPFALSLLVALVSGGGVARAAANAAIVIAFLYFIQGFAIIWYSFEVRGTGRLIRLLAALLLAGFFPIPIVLGILETVIPFRRLMAGAAGEGTEDTAEDTEEGNDESDPSGGHPPSR